MDAIWLRSLKDEAAELWVLWPAVIFYLLPVAVPLFKQLVDASFRTPAPRDREVEEAAQWGSRGDEPLRSRRPQEDPPESGRTRPTFRRPPS